MKEIILLLLIMIFLVGCIPGDGKHTSIKPAGFFWGIWHGWIAPISLIVQIFNNDIRVYERNNSGWWYDFGFYIAILGGFGGLSLTRKRKKK
jgi:polyferredoxin